MTEVGNTLRLIYDQHLILRKGLGQHIETLAFEDIAQNPVVACLIATFETRVRDKIFNQGGLAGTSWTVNNQNPPWFKLIGYNRIVMSADQHVTPFLLEVDLMIA